MSEPFIAEIRIFGGNFAIRNWAFCDGQLLPISQNSALFSLIGTTYGGDGRTTMGLPNLKGRAPMHPGNGPGLTPRRLGQFLGAENVALDEAEIPSHTHTLRADAGKADTGTPSNTVVLGRSKTGDAYQTNTTASLVSMGSAALSKTGGNQAHTNVQPFLTLNFIIALQGLYPSRS